MIIKKKTGGSVKLLIVMIIFASVFLSACDKKGDIDERLHIVEETIDVDGLEEEFSLFFLADSHISLCDERDEELLPKAAERSIMFRTDDIDAWERFDIMMGEVKREDNDIVLLGGDIVDSAMYASIDHVSEQLEGLKCPYLYYMGNHDFEYGDEYFSQRAYEEYLPRLEDMHGSAPYQVKEYDDLIIFAVDDHDCQIDKPVLDAYKAEASKGKPIILGMHVPIEPVTGDDSLIRDFEKINGEGCVKRLRLIIGENGSLPNEVTREFLDLVLAEDSPVILVLAGHIHFYHRDMLNDKILQIVTGPAYAGEGLRIVLK